MGRKGHLLGGGGYLADGAPHFALALIDLDAAEPTPALLPLSFLAHGVVIDPNNPSRAAVFEKKGPGACIVDLRSRTVEQPIQTPATRKFYGHGAFSADGALLYATESMVDREFAGVLVVRDARTLEELGTIPTYGTSPHDCQLLEDGKTMVVANGGGPIAGDDLASVTYVDLESQRLLDKVVLRSPRFNTGHVAVNSKGALAVVSAPRDGLPNFNQQLGAVTLRPSGGEVTTVHKPRSVVRRMLGETLSVVVNEEDRVVMATHPLGDCVSIWRLDDAECLGTLELAGPRGVAITLDRAWYVISHVEGPVDRRSVRLSAFSTATRERIAFGVAPSFTSGSHIFVHDLPAGPAAGPAASAAA